MRDWESSGFYPFLFVLPVGIELWPDIRGIGLRRSRARNVFPKIDHGLIKMLPRGHEEQSIRYSDAKRNYQ